ncbi:MAG: 2-oxoacid:acceptor oxidoreductase subunit alpha [Coriobacteriia bacterium]|nr:2-oxoacid:acceptor oxidoreductase subunit alpha [Coriobacteriia bacterium]
MAQRDPDAVEVRIKIGGPAGFGIKAAGQTLARLFTRAGYETFDLTEYPSLIKGGHNNYHLRISSEEIFSHVEPVDVLVALDRDTVTLHLDELTEGAAIIFDPGDLDIGELEDVPDTVCAIPVPLKEIVYAAGGISIMRNTAALGAVLGHIAFPLEYLTSSIEQQFAHKAPEIAEQNVACATAGYEYARDHECPFPYELAPRESDEERILVDGNEAVGAAALAAGIGLYCAYPMTPASSLLHFFAKNAEKYDLAVKHTEDELAAMNMVVGGAFGGTRSMCATSGGGFALMVEAFGLAGVSESAVVVGLFTRPGPATGMPTWTEQSDLRFAIHAAQGEFPRVVLAPGDREDAFNLTWQAFNIADVLQTPVIILGDTYLSDNRQSIPPFDTSHVEIDRGEIITEGEVEDYARHRVTNSGVSPRAIPGVRGAEQIVNSYEHDEHGYGAQGEIAEVRIAQNEKRMRKMDLARMITPSPAYYGPDATDLSILAFGSTKMPVREAMKWLDREGILVNLMQVVTLWPFPAEEVSEFLGKAKRTAIIEGNFTGQLQGLVRQECLMDVDHTLHRYDGRPFSPEQVCGFIKEVLG